MLLQYLLAFALGCISFGLPGALIITWLVLTIHLGYRLFKRIMNGKNKKEDVKSDNKSDKNKGDE